MGYNTDFEGAFTIDRPVDDQTYELLVGLASTRRVKRNVDPRYGVEGEFYIDDSDPYHQSKDPTIIDYNRPPATQPGLWCQWMIQEDHQTIEWDGNEKFYSYTEWIRYLIDKVLAPNGYVVNGEVNWRGEEFSDIGTIVVTDNKVEEKPFGY